MLQELQTQGSEVGQEYLVKFHLARFHYGTLGVSDRSQRLGFDQLQRYGLRDTHADRGINVGFFLLCNLNSNLLLNFIHHQKTAREAQRETFPEKMGHLIPRFPDPQEGQCIIHGFLHRPQLDFRQRSSAFLRCPISPDFQRVFLVPRLFYFVHGHPALAYKIDINNFRPDRTFLLDY
jgi:hypothetical protein